VGVRVSARKGTKVLVLDDQSLARLCIAAGQVPRAQRRRWLARIGERLEAGHVEPARLKIMKTCLMRSSQMSRSIDTNSGTDSRQTKIAFSADDAYAILSYLYALAVTK
jgi:hypothetical protein